MRYIEIPPSPFLSRDLESFWYLESNIKPKIPPREKILPDGCSELIFNLAEPFRRFHANGKIERQPQILLAGQMRSYAQIAPVGQVQLLGIRFRPGGAFAFLHVPMHELTDQIIEGSEVLGNWVNELQEKLMYGRSLRSRIELIEVALSQRLQKRWQSDRVIAEAVRRILATEGRVQVESLFADLGLSGRQVERKFQTMVGLSPKMLARIMRFQKIFKLAGQQPDSWSGIAHDCGYYDQAHLIHDFQQFAGQNPSAFLLAQTEMSSYLMRKNRMPVFYNTSR